MIAASIITSRTREVLGDFNMSCDDTGKLILRPRPTNNTWQTTIDNVFKFCKYLFLLQIPWL